MSTELSMTGRNSFKWWFLCRKRSNVCPKELNSWRIRQNSQSVSSALPFASTSRSILKFHSAVRPIYGTNSAEAKVLFDACEIVLSFTGNIELGMIMVISSSMLKKSAIIFSCYPGEVLPFFPPYRQLQIR